MKRVVNMMVLALLVLVLGACATAGGPPAHVGPSQGDRVGNSRPEPRGRGPIASIKRVFQHDGSEQNRGRYNPEASEQAGYAVGENDLTTAQGPIGETDNGYGATRSGLLPGHVEPTKRQLELEILYLDNHIAELESQNLSLQPETRSTRTAELEAQIQSLLAQIAQMQSQRSTTASVSNAVMVNVPGGTTISKIWKSSYTNDYSSYRGLCAAFLDLNKGAASCDDIEAGKLYAFPVPSGGRIIIPSDTTVSTTVAAPGGAHVDLSALQEEVDSLAKRLAQAIADQKAAEDAKKKAEEALATANGRIETLDGRVKALTDERDAELEKSKSIWRNWMFWVFVLGIPMLAALILATMLFFGRRKAEKDNSELVTANSGLKASNHQLEMDLSRANTDLTNARRERDEKDIELKFARLENKALAEQLAEQQAMIDEHFVKFELKPDGEGQIHFDDTSAKNRKHIYLPKWGDGFVRIGKDKVGSDTAAIATYFKKNEAAAGKHEIAFATVTPVPAIA